MRGTRRGDHEGMAQDPVTLNRGCGPDDFAAMLARHGVTVLGRVA
ncbi:hypothetical protein [Roseobacter fucihabitans]|nr:hypothetical protein [Roseobacter litoralis]